MEEDIRCCGTGTCLINAEGHCWCGQQWDGTKMCFVAPTPPSQPALSAAKSAAAGSPTDRAE